MLFSYKHYGHISLYIHVYSICTVHIILVCAYVHLAENAYPKKKKKGLFGWKNCIAEDVCIDLSVFIFLFYGESICFLERMRLLPWIYIYTANIRILLSIQSIAVRLLIWYDQNFLWLDSFDFWTGSLCHGHSWTKLHNCILLFPSLSWYISRDLGIVGTCVLFLLVLNEDPEF